MQTGDASNWQSRPAKRSLHEAYEGEEDEPTPYYGYVQQNFQSNYNPESEVSRPPKRSKLAHNNGSQFSSSNVAANHLQPDAGELFDFHDFGMATTETGRPSLVEAHQNNSVNVEQGDARVPTMKIPKRPEISHHLKSADRAQHYADVPSPYMNLDEARAVLRKTSWKPLKLTKPLTDADINNIQQRIYRAFIHDQAFMDNVAMPPADLPEGAVHLCKQNLLDRIDIDEALLHLTAWAIVVCCHRFMTILPFLTSDRTPYSTSLRTELL